MPVLLRIAFRNLMEHKAKTLIIGIIIALGVIVLIVGNSLMDTARLGIQRAFIDNYTGHVMVSGVAEGQVSLFGVQGGAGMLETPTIPDYERILNYLNEHEMTESVTSQITGFAQLSLGELPGDEISIFFGIEPTTYHGMFDNMDIIEGEYLSPLLSEEGIMISEEKVRKLEEEVEEALVEDEELEERDIDIQIGDAIRLQSFSNAGFKIREVPLRAIYRYKTEAQGLGVDLITYIDSQTARALSGMTVGYKGEIQLAQEETSFLESSSEEDLFSTDTFEIDNEEATELDEEKLDNILGDTSKRDAALELDTGSWNYLLVKLKDQRDIDDFIREVNAWFKEEGIAARAGDWEQAAGPFATTADVIKTVFNIAIIIVGIVAVIIMMNTLVLSIIERTSEIGTMRALGAQKGFVWKMFFYETTTISLVFGVVGIVLALITVAILNAVGIPATNVFLRVLFAGKELHPAVSIGSIFGSLLIVTLIGFLAHIYPVAVALKIQPVRAIQTE